jgi:hypothetical protein
MSYVMLSEEELSQCYLRNRLILDDAMRKASESVAMSHLESGLEESCELTFYPLTDGREPEFWSVVCIGVIAEQMEWRSQLLGVAMCRDEKSVKEFQKAATQWASRADWKTGMHDLRNYQFP